MGRFSLHKLCLITFVSMTAFISTPSLNAANSVDNKSLPLKVMTQTKQQNLSPNDVLKRLKEGNQRFTSGNMKNRNLLAKIAMTAQGQYPIAVILSCMDSRTPSELVFDQGVGDIFAIRIAGNIQNSDILGSMEFGTQLSGSKLIAVIGHTSCGAIRGACQQAKLGNLTGLLQKIEPAVQQTAGASGGTKDCNKAVFIDEIAKNNVLEVMKQIQTNSPVIQKLLKEGKIGLVGGIQDIATGAVVFFDDQAIMPQMQ